MRKTILITLFALSCVSSTLAQSEWKGFYVGGNGFASSDKSDATENLRINQVTNITVGNTLFVVPATTREFAASRRKTNWSGGGQAGYQWQARGFVFGPEADFNLFERTVSITQSFQLPPTLITQSTTVEARRDVQINSEFSLRARAGGAFGKTLVYGTFGYGRAHVEVSRIDTFTNPGGATQTTPPATLGPSGPVVTTGSEKLNMDGWTGGFGVERKLNKRLSLSFEYRHTDFGSKTFTFSNLTAVNTGPEARGTNGLAGLPGGVDTSPGAPNSNAFEPTRLSLKSDSFGVRVNFHF